MDKKASNILFPGREVENDLGLKITVYPLGIVHIKKFTSDIVRLVNASQSIRVRKDADKKEVAQQFVMGMIPLVMTDAMDLIEECVKIDPPEVKFTELPHWVLPNVVEIWIGESFGEEKKWRPWLMIVEKTISRITGKPFSISEIWSKYSSQQDTVSVPSSTTNSPDSHTEDGA